MTPEECSRINSSLLRRIANNDPDLTSIDIANSPWQYDDDEGSGCIVPTSHEEWAELARALGQSRQIKNVTIMEELEIPAQNLGTLFRGLRSNTSIEEIHFITSQFRCPLHDFAAFVENNPSLLKLHIHLGYDTSADWMQHLTRALSRGTVRSIKTISLFNQRLNDLALTELCVALRNHPQLEELSLECNSPRRQCCVEIASMLSNQHCFMKELSLCRCGLSDTECIILANALVTNKRLMRLNLQKNNIGHEGINVIANSLANNASLRELRVEDNPGTQNARGWDAFSMTIGGSGAQTINDTYMSNHMLWMITPGIPSKIINILPTNVYEFLQLNRNADKTFVARAKIFKNHYFDGDFDLHLFQSMNVNILPHVLEWVGGDCAVEDKEECDVNSDTIGSGNVEDHDMGSGSDESGIGEAESVDSDEVEVQWQDWWYDHSPLPNSYGEGSYDHYRSANISPPRPEFNRLAIIYRIVRHVPLVLIERA
jgi:hypothetical protein